jgi:hypothetical protein
MTSDGKTYSSLNRIVHYRGIVENDMTSLASFSFSEEETMGLVATANGNLVFGKLDQQGNRTYILYNDNALLAPFLFDCNTNTTNPRKELPAPPQNGLPTVMSVNCVNWYWETDYDIFVGKGSLANVNSYIQGVFNQVQTMYNNDGVSITLLTLYVWTATDPYTGSSTSNYLNQFGTYRTSFNGDLASLLGYGGGGGIAWIDGLCDPSTNYRMSYSGINSSYNTVPTYSWTVEVVTHEQGHQLGSRHTHDCVWNGNNTRIDGCGPAAGYSSGSCATGPIPVKGTIMSYCHLSPNPGIDFTLGFGPQPAALILNNVNNSSCLLPCTSCNPPSQPGTISGVTSYCGSVSQTYTIAAVPTATSYTWTLPSGWSGTSTTNSITVTTAGSGGTISVTANNSCGNSTARTLSVAGNTAPSTPGNLIGNTTVCQGSSQNYSVGTVNGATSYIWTLPSGWTGTSTTNNITVVAGAAGGSVSVVAVNACGNSSPRTVTVTVSPVPSSPGTVNGSATACANSAQVYNVNPVNGATSYIWTLPSGWTGTSTTQVITALTTTTGGTVSVVAVNACGNSAPASLNVTMTTVPAQPSTITAAGGNTKVCPGDVKSYSIPAVAGATSYTWYPPSGGTITSGQGTTAVTVSFTPNFTASDSLIVTANNACGSSPIRFINILRNTPARPGVISGTLSGICNGTAVPYSVTNVAGINYNWYFSAAGATVASGQGTNAITANFTSAWTTGTLNVTASNACGTSTVRSATVRSTYLAPTGLTGATTVCANQQNVPYSCNPVSGATSYTWSAPTGARIFDGTVLSTTNTLTTTATSVTVNFATSAGNVRVKANNACGAGSNATLAVAITCREAAVSGQFESSVFPNPVSDFMNVTFFSSTESPFMISVIDLAGKEVVVTKGTAQEGENQVDMDLTDLAPGIYFTEIICDGKTNLKKIVVQ